MFEEFAIEKSLGNAESTNYGHIAYANSHNNKYGATDIPKGATEKGVTHAHIENAVKVSRGVPRESG